LFPIEGLLPPKRFIIDDESEDEPEPEPIDDGEFYAVFDDSYSNWGGSLPDITIVSPPKTTLPDYIGDPVPVPKDPPPTPREREEPGEGNDGGSSGGNSDGNSPPPPPKPCVTVDQFLIDFLKDQYKNGPSYEIFANSGVKLANYIANSMFADLLSLFPEPPKFFQDIQSFNYVTSKFTYVYNLDSNGYYYYYDEKGVLHDHISALTLPPNNAGYSDIYLAPAFLIRLIKTICIIR